MNLTKYKNDNTFKINYIQLINILNYMHYIFLLMSYNYIIQNIITKMYYVNGMKTLKSQFKEF